MRMSSCPKSSVGRRLLLLLLAAAVPSTSLYGRDDVRAADPAVRLMPIGDAWAANSVNAAVYRNDPVTTHGDRQYAAYYDCDGRVIVAARTIGETNWTTHVTTLT